MGRPIDSASGSMAADLPRLQILMALTSPPSCHNLGRTTAAPWASDSIILALSRLGAPLPRDTITDLINLSTCHGLPDHQSQDA